MTTQHHPLAGTDSVETTAPTPQNDNARSPHAPLPESTRLRIVQNTDDRLIMIVDPAPNRLAFETIAGATIALGFVLFFVTSLVVPMLDLPRAIRDSVGWLFRDGNIWAVVVLFIGMLAMVALFGAALYGGFRARYSQLILDLQPGDLTVRRVFRRRMKSATMPLHLDSAAWIEKKTSFCQIAFGRREALASRKERLRFAKSLNEADQGWLANEINDFFDIPFTNFPGLTFQFGRFEYSPHAEEPPAQVLDRIAANSTAMIDSRDRQRLRIGAEPRAATVRQRLTFGLLAFAGISVGVLCVSNLVWRWLPGHDAAFLDIVVVTAIPAIAAVFATYVALTSLFRHEFVEFDRERFSYRWNLLVCRGELTIPTRTIDDFTVISFSRDPRSYSDAELREHPPLVSLELRHEGGRRACVFKNLKRRFDIENIAALLRSRWGMWGSEDNQSPTPTQNHPRMI